MRGLTDLKTHRESLRNEFMKVSDLPSQIEKKKREKERLSHATQEMFLVILDKNIVSGNWDIAYSEIKNQQKNIKQRKGELEKALAG